MNRQTFYVLFISVAANLGNFHSWRGEYAQALPYYQQFLALAPSLQDMEGEGKVCHNLGYAHYCLGQYRDAVRSEKRRLISCRCCKSHMLI